MILARSPSAAVALDLVRALQRRMVEAQEGVARSTGSDERFAEVEWLRDEGRHGGGARFSLPESGPASGVFDRGSVNVSQVHYDDEPDRRLASATALSTIIHPRPPRAPSVHVHVSWTEQRSGGGYWRVMADLNPSLQSRSAGDFTARAKARFDEALRAATGSDALYAEASRQGDRYFEIPALGRHRGVSHFYLEQHATDDAEADRALARRVAEAAIDTHAALVAEALRSSGEASASDDERAEQRAYHTLYLFQVLTLDRGTTSGLLVHDQNDVGILGSLPSRVDLDLLAAWRERVPPLVQPLVTAIVEALDGETRVALVDEAAKRRLAAVVRAFYRKHPQALDLQARGDVVPPTVQNHGRA